MHQEFFVKKKDKNIKRAISAIRDILDNDFIREEIEYENEFNKIIDRLNDDTFRLAVVGEFSSGKSTFINALMGKDLLKHGTTEITATITEVENTIGGENSNRFDVFYLNGKKEENININKLLDYTTTKSKIDDVAKNIAKVVVKTHILDVSYPLYFIDTPGLNGVADKHQEKTIELIKSAHACIYIIPIRGISLSDIEFIRKICNYQHSFIFIQNFIDEIKILESETVEEKIAKQKEILNNEFKNGEIYYDMVAISARKALLARDNSLTENGEKLTEVKRREYYKESQFERALIVIDKVIRNNIKKNIQYKDALRIAIKKIQILIQDLNFLSEIEKEKIEDSEYRKRIHNQRLLEIHREKKQRNKENIIKFIEEEGSNAKKNIDKYLETEMRRLISEIKNKIDEINSIEKIKNNNIENEVNYGLVRLKNTCLEYIRPYYHNILSQAVWEVVHLEEKNEGIPATILNPDFIFLESDKKTITFNRTESDKSQALIDEKKEELQNYKLERIKMERELLVKQKEIASLLKEKSEIEYNINMAREDLDRDLRIMGAEPKPEKCQRVRIVEEERIWLLRMFGPKKKEILYECEDTSKADKWKEEYNALWSGYNSKCYNYTKNKETIEDRLKEINQEKDFLEKNSSDIKRNEKNLVYTIKSLEKEKEIIEKKAMEEYIDNIKKQLLKDVSTALSEDSSIYESIVLFLNDVSDLNKKEILKKAMLVFEDRWSSRESELEERLESHNEEVRIETDKLLDLVSKRKNVLEDVLCQI